MLVGCRVVQKFNTGWSVGKVLGVEDNRRKHSYGQYFVKHPGDRYPFYDQLAGEYYGESWFLLKKRAPCEQTSKRNTRRKKYPLVYSLFCVPSARGGSDRFMPHVRIRCFWKILGSLDSYFPEKSRV